MADRQESSSGVPDSDWLALIGGDEEAFDAIYRLESRGVHDFLIRLVRDRQWAADLTQMTFVQVWERRSTLRDVGRARGWLYAIARHQAMSFLRRRRPEDPTEDIADLALASSAGGPEAVALDDEAADLVWSAAASLDTRQYTVLDLSVRQNLSTPEIADAIGVGGSHAAVLVNRAKGALGNAVRALLVARSRNICDRLDAMVPAGVRKLTPAQRRSVDHHLRRCDVCQRTAITLTAPAEILGGLVLLPLPDGLTIPVDPKNFPSQTVIRAARLRRKSMTTTHKPSRTTVSRFFRTIGRGLSSPVRVATAAAVVAGLTAAVIAVVPGTRSHRPASAAPSQPFNYLEAEAASLHDSAPAIVSFVQHRIGTDNYAGVLRGPVGTLWDMSGDGADRALLLQGLLRYTPARAQLVFGKVWGVEMATGSGPMTYVGPNASSDPTAKPTAIPLDEYQTIALSLTTVPTTGTPSTERLGEFQAATLAAHDLVAWYQVKGGQATLEVTGPGKTLTSTENAASAKSQTLDFTITAPGEDETTVRRQLFTSAYADYLSTFAPTDRFTITVTGGVVPLSVFTHEAHTVAGQERDTGQADGYDALDHVVAYSFLANADANTTALVKQLGLPAHVASPRISIVSNVANPENPGTRVISLDLRKNNLVVTGSPSATRTINTNVSLYDASLESEILQQVTGQQTISAASVLSASLTGTESSIPSRVLTLAQSIHRLLATPTLPTGTSFEVAASGHPADGVTFTRNSPDVTVSASPSVERALHTNTDADVKWLADNPKIGSDTTGNRAALATDSALSLTSQLPSNFVETYQFHQTQTFLYDASVYSPKSSTPQISVTTVPNLQINYLPYYYGNGATSRTKPRSSTFATINVGTADLQDSNVIQQCGTGTTSGFLIDMISRKVFAELVKTGSALVKFRYCTSTNSVSPTVRLFNVGTTTQNYDINGTTRPEKVLELNGNWASDNSPKPSSASAGPTIVDPNDKAGGALNKFEVLDDPQYPFFASVFFDGNDLQTDVPGTVTDASNGGPVPDATVSVTTASSTAITWPDGSFSLPAFKKAFGTFKVKVSAPGYNDLTVSVDFAKPGAFPLHFSLTPATPSAARPPTWVDATNAQTILPTLGLSDRSQAVIAGLVADPSIAVLVPGRKGIDDYGPIDDWMVANATTGELYPMLPDGLLGATTEFDIVGQGLTTAKQWARDKANDWAKDKINDWSKEQIEKFLKTHDSGSTGGTGETGDGEEGSNGDFPPGSEPITFFAGHLAGWYYFAAGVLTGVATSITKGGISLCKLHAIAVRTALSFVKTQFGDSLAAKAGAVIAIAALAAKTYVTWGLAGQGCAYNPLP